MIDWLKKRWKMVLAGLVTISAFLLGRRGKEAAEDVVNLRDKEIKILKEKAEKERKRKEKALVTFLHQGINPMEQSLTLKPLSVGPLRPKWHKSR